MRYLVIVTPILSAIPDEIYPSYNSGYEYGESKEMVLTEEEFFHIDAETHDAKVIGVLPDESKIC